MGTYKGRPVAVSGHGLSTPIGEKGLDLRIPLDFDQADAETGVRAVSFSFRAKVQSQREVSFKLVAPNGVERVISRGGASSEFAYPRTNLTDDFKNATAVGDWHLIATVAGQPDDGILEDYELIVEPNFYDCR